jgi:hypothetical protein
MIALAASHIRRLFKRDPKHQHSDDQKNYCHQYHDAQRIS